MQFTRKTALALAAAAALAAILPGLVQPAAAQAWPAKPVTIIVPFAPGGTTDILARLIGQKLADRLGQPFVVENRPGSGGNVGVAALSKATPDGYTIGMGTVSSHGINPSLYPTMPYDHQKDFTPLSLLAIVPNILIVNQDVKANPDKFNYGSTGSGSSQHMASELLKLKAGVQMTHVPYKGSPPALVDLISGQIQVMFDNAPTALPQVQGGKVRALAVATKERLPALPELPTMGEFIPGFEATSWQGMFAPSGVPKAITDKLSAEIQQIVPLPDVQERIKQLGAVPVGSNGPDFATHIVRETTKWAEVVKSAGARPD